MDKEQLIKLAVVAGYAKKYIGSTGQRGSGDFYCKDGLGIEVQEWQPHKDIAQAMQLAQQAQKKGIAEIVIHINSWDWLTYIDSNFDEHVLANDGTQNIEELICKAVLKATEQG